MPELTLGGFLTQLFESGEVIVSDKLGAAPCIEELKELEARHRAAIGLRFPAFSPKTAAWAAELFYRGCELCVRREAGEEAVVAAFSRKCPEARSPSVDYSADLVFQFLPDLLKLARRISPADPLTAALSQLATEWPLCAPGSEIRQAGSIDSFWLDPALRMLYLDRIMQHRDYVHANEPRVREAIGAALGGHPEIAPHWEDWLNRHE